MTNNRARIAVGSLNTLVALLVALGLTRMWRTSDPRLALMALSLAPLLSTVVALLVPQRRWLTLAAAIPNLVVFGWGLVALALLLVQTTPHYLSQSVGIALLLSFGILNFAVLYEQYLRAQPAVAADANALRRLRG